MPGLLLVPEVCIKCRWESLQGPGAKAPFVVGLIQGPEGPCSLRQEQRQKQVQKQIPCGNDSRKNSATVKMQKQICSTPMDKERPLGTPA